jgi:potassium channel LctB
VTTDAISAKRAGPHDALLRALEYVSDLSVGALLGAWVGMVVGVGMIYWIADATVAGALRDANGPVPGTFGGLLTALYFSFVTATSVGFGDVVPMGAARLLAVAEATAGLLLFGALISKLVSRRQDRLIQQIDETTFEERLGRLRTNLHMVLSELQTLTELCTGSPPTARILVRIESAGAVLVGELRSIHDLLYRPDVTPDEQVLEAILANVGSCLDEFGALVECLPSAVRSRTLRRELEAMSRLAEDICGECVPRQYAPELRAWMDHVQASSHNLRR